MANQFQKQLEELMKREMTREEFLKGLGLALLGVIGISTVLRNLNETFTSKSSKKRTKYGQTKYGV